MIQNDDYAILNEYLNQDPELRGIADREAQSRADEYAAKREKKQNPPTELEKIAAAKAPDALRAKPISTVEYVPVKYLVYPYIPLGKLTLLQGDSGVGKTALCCKLAASISLGVPLQNVPCMQGNSLLFTVEDDESTIKGRLEADGADQETVFIVDNACDAQFGDIDAIENLIGKYSAKLVIFDPIQAFLGSKIDMNKANEIRPVLARLADLAKRRECAIVMVAHLGKGASDKKAVYRSLGSVDVPAQCRSILQVMRNPADEKQCVMVHIKCSIAPTAKSIAYRIVDKGGVRWEGMSDLTVKDLDRPPEEKPREVDYDSDPLVLFLQVVVKDNPHPDGIFLAWSTFIRYAETGGFFIGDGTREIIKRLKFVKATLEEKNDIYVKVTGTGYSDIGQKREQSHIEYGEQAEPVSESPKRGIWIAKRARPKEETW